MTSLYNISKPTESQPVSVETFIGTLFQYRDKIHLAHLSTNSYAAHMALNESYEYLLDIIDDLVETAQSDKILNLTIPQSSTSDSQNSVQELLNYVQNNRYVFVESYQLNILDELVSSLNKTIYKLKHLK